MDVQHDEELGALVVRGVGEVTLENCVALVEAAVGHAAFERGMPIIYDISAMEPVPAGIEDVGVAVDEVARFNWSDARIAIVAESNLAFGLSRMMVGVGSIELQRNIRSFRTVEEARAWLRTQPSSGAS